MANEPSTLQSKAIKKIKAGKTTRPVQLRKLLRRKSGATLDQMQCAFGWQPHTARAAVSRLRKSGDNVVRSVGAKGSVYRIISESAGL